MMNPCSGRTDSWWNFWADLAWGILDLFGDLLSEALSGLLSTAFDT